MLSIGLKIKSIPFFDDFFKKSSKSFSTNSGIWKIHFAEKLKKMIMTWASFLISGQRLKHVNRSLAFRSVIDFLESLCSRSPGIMKQIIRSLNKLIILAAFMPNPHYFLYRVPTSSASSTLKSKTFGRKTCGRKTFSKKKLRTKNFRTLFREFRTKNIRTNTTSKNKHCTKYMLKIIVIPSCISIYSRYMMIITSTRTFECNSRYTMNYDKPKIE